jgi:hypothetical protein
VNRRGWAVVALLGATAAAASDSGFERIVRRVIDAPEVTGTVVLWRSDPFGGPPERLTGRLWYIPGRGLRYRAGRESGGEDLAIDRAAGTLLLYRASEGIIYRAPWERAPARLRRLVEDPEAVIERNLGVVAERRVIGGAKRSGYRLRRASLGDSLPDVSVWLAGDDRTGFPRWLTIASSEDSLTVEFRDLVARGAARPRDLAIAAPRGTPVEPLDPRELLPGGESR